jgi:hypothetical protein
MVERVNSVVTESGEIEITISRDKLARTQLSAIATTGSIETDFAIPTEMSLRSSFQFNEPQFLAEPLTVLVSHLSTGASENNSRFEEVLKRFEAAVSGQPCPAGFYVETRSGAIRVVNDSQ